MNQLEPFFKNEEVNLPTIEDLDFYYNVMRYNNEGLLRMSEEQIWLSLVSDENQYNFNEMN